MSDNDRMPQRGGDQGWSAPPPPPDDEISLFDLWLVLVRRRWLMAATFAVVVLAGLAFALTRSDVYEYSATLAVGQVYEPGDEDSGPVLAPVQSPSGVVAEIRSVHAPAAVREVVDDGADAGYLPEVNVSSPEGSKLVRLSGETAAKNAGALSQTMQAIADRVESSHAPRIDSARNSIQQAIESAKNELERLQAREASLKEQLTSLDARAKTVKERQEELEAELAKLTNQRNEAGNDASSRYLMALNSQIAAVRGDLRSVGDELQQQLPAKRRQARLDQETVRTDIDAKQKAITRDQARLERITETRLTSEPERALRPTGTSSKLILALSMVLGAMLAVFGAFVWEFVTRANAYVREQENV